MDEEEELENTLIGQEEEAPAVNTGDFIMGAGTLAPAFGQEPASNPFSVQVFEDPSFNTLKSNATDNEAAAFFLSKAAQSELEKTMGQFDFTKAYDNAADLYDQDLNVKYASSPRIIARGVASENEKLQEYINTFAKPDSPQGNFLARMETGEDLTPQEIQNAQAFATSMGTTFDPKTGYSREAFVEARNAEFNPQMTGLRPVDPRTGEFLSQDVIDAGKAYGMTFPSQVSLPVPQAPQAPIAPMGQEETRARLGGMTLNEYLNAPAGTPGVSGLRTDPQGRMVPNIAQFQAQPEITQPVVDSSAPSANTQPPVDALSSFERDSLARQQRIGGTGSFAGDSAAREARLAERDRLPGETQTERDTRIAQSRTTGGQTEGLSFDDARRRAEGQLAARGVRNPSASQVNALARGIQAAEPERLAELATQRAKDDITIGESQTVSADRDSFNTSISNSTSAGGAIDYNKALNEYVRGGGSNRGYLEFLRKGQELAQEAIDAGRKPEIKVIELDGFKVLTQDDKYMTATTIGGDELSTSAIRTLEGKIELITDAEEDYFSGDPERKRRAERTITALDIKGDFGAQLTAKDYFEPDANDNSKTFDPDALTGKDKEAYDFAIKNPNSPQSASILRLLGAN